MKVSDLVLKKKSDIVFNIGTSWMLVWILIIPVIIGNYNVIFFELGIGGYILAFIIYVILREKKEKKQYENKL